MWYNSIMLWLLRSPLHPLLSGSTLIVTYTGRKSGTIYSLPANYVRVGEELLTVSLSKRTWWRNLRGGGDVTIRLRGKELPARAEVFEDLTSVAQGLAEIVRTNPKWARYLKVKLYAKGDPSMIELDIAARDRVVIRTTIVG
jgi:deazaflavin-dependent oxidoreductase (nitroreductase family)